MTEIDIFQAIQTRFEASAILRDVPLRTYKSDYTEDRYCFVMIIDQGRGCFDVSFEIITPYQGQKEAMLIRREIFEVLGRVVDVGNEGHSLMFCPTHRIKPSHQNSILFKAKVF